MNKTWQNNPKLKGKFHPEAPDDLQVIVHNGGPRTTTKSPELVWVTVTSEISENLFTGKVLNKPQQLSSIDEGSEIKFIAPAGENLIMVTDKYLTERNNWKVQPCSQCGLDELFDAPSDLISVLFPDIPEGASPEMFTAFCGACGGVQVVQNPDCEIDEPETQQENKPWWKFW